jgi:hypothetical protein
MGDNCVGIAQEAGEEEQAEEVDTVAMEAIRQALLETRIDTGMVGDEDVNEIRANALSIVEVSQGNDIVHEVVLYRYRDYHRDYKMLRVLGEGFGNLKAPRALTIRSVYGGCD